MPKKSNLHWFVNGSIFIGGLILIGGQIVGNKLLFAPTIPDWYHFLILSLSLPWILVSCAFIIKHRGIPRYGLPSITGSWAVTQAMIGVIFVGVLEIFVVYNLIIDLFQLMC